jgi:hypothetical protein
MAVWHHPKNHSLIILYVAIASTTVGIVNGQISSSDSAVPWAASWQDPVPQPSEKPPQPGQLAPSGVPPGTPNPVGQAEEKRIMGVIPNYRTAEMSAEGTPLTAKQKLHIAVKDSFDYPLFITGAAYAGIYQAENSHPQFGQGAKGYFSRFGTSYTDQLDGNMMTEGFLPVLLREDPRYFRMATGSFKKRLWYSVSRIVVTRTDSGHEIFNFSEFLGNGIAAGVGLSYYSDNRDVGDYIQNLAIQLGTDTYSQVLKEFWPDIKRHFKNRQNRIRQAKSQQNQTTP